MTTHIQVHLNMSAGADFLQRMVVKNPDQSLKNLTGYTLYGRMSKHPGALNAETSTSEDIVYKTIPLVVTITSAENGNYEITLPAETTSKLTSGKYVYSINMDDGSGHLDEAANGLVFVTETVRVGSTIDPNYP